MVGKGEAAVKHGRWLLYVALLFLAIGMLAFWIFVFWR
jgi:hypothetical protein